MKTFWRLKRKSHTSTAIELKRLLPELKNSRIDDIEYYLRRMDIQFYDDEKIQSPIWIRLTLPLAFMVMGTLFILLPVNYIITGQWGYKYEPLTNWLRSLGF